MIDPTVTLMEYLLDFLWQRIVSVQELRAVVRRSISCLRGMYYFLWYFNCPFDKLVYHSEVCYPLQ